MADLPPGPRHLLEFDGDPNLRFCYRTLVPNINEHGTAKSGLSYCEACRSPLSRDERPRLKPLPRLTKTIEKLINKRAKKLSLKRFESFKLKRFFNGSQFKIVKCSECQYVNKKPIIKREDLVNLKDKQILKVAEPQKDLVEEPVEVANTKRKRKKKKKKKHSNPNSLLTDDEEEKDDTPILVAAQLAPLNSLPSQRKTGRISLSQYLKSQTKDTSSSAIFRQALMSSTTSTPQIATQTPVVARSAVRVQVKTTAKSTTPSSSKRKSVKMHKQLKQFLSSKPAEPDNTASNLNNFLALLG